MQSNLRAFQFGLANLLAAVTCFGVAIGSLLLAIQFTSNFRFLLNDPEMIVAKILFGAAISAAVGGAIGAVCNRFQRGPATGAIVGVVLGAVWGIGTLVYDILNGISV